MAIREGRWDCPVCGQVGNRGPVTECPSCGAPRGPEVPFYLPEDAPEVVDPAALAAAADGPDWSCEFCGGDNPAASEACENCSAPRGTAPVRPIIERRTVPSVPPPAPKRSTPAGKRPTKKIAGGCCGLGCLGALAFFFLVVLLGAPSTETVTAQSASWERAIEVQASQVVRKTAWQDEVPPSAQVLSSERVERTTERVQVGTEQSTRTTYERVQTGTERVKVGTRDLGNGYFEDIYEDRPVYDTVERQETVDEPVYERRPVYDLQVTYDALEWTTLREAVASGEGWSAHWPDPDLGPEQRAGPRRETYRVRLRGEDGTTYTWETGNEARWRAIQPGRRYEARVSSSGKVLSLKPL